MASNGCGAAGSISRAWRWFLKTPPPWEGCCDEHDLAYEQGGAAEVRKWADGLMRDCMTRMGYPVRAAVYYRAVRALGWFFWGKGGGNGR